MIIYLIKSTLLLGLLIGVYKLLLEHEKMHRFNRFFLLFSLIFGLTAPLISFEINPEQSLAGFELQQMERVVNQPVEQVSRSVEPLIIPQNETAVSTTNIAPDKATNSNWSISFLDILIAMYGLITMLLFIRFLGGLLQIRQKVKSGFHQKLDGATLVLLDEPITPQSFLRYIFLNKESFEAGEIEPEIINHELTHIRQLHSMDVLFIEFLKVIFWFNPLMYIYKHAIQLNHEFLADDSVVKSGSSINDYQELLIRVNTGNTSLKTTSSINFSLTKKRVKMMFRTYSPFRAGSKTILLFPFIGLLILSFCSQKPNNSGQQSNFTYSVPELHMDAKRSQELGIPPSFGAHFTSSGEPFTGTQKIYYTKNDSLHMEMYFEDGVNTGSLMNRDGDIIRQVRGIYQNVPHLMEMYRNGNLIYKDIPPTDSNDGLGQTRMWHDNGQLAVEVYYTGFTPDKERQGLLTEYDEEGNITMQERYEDGELIETIK